jgi:OOP family OmpA-OmpF porin
VGSLETYRELTQLPHALCKNENIKVNLNDIEKVSAFLKEYPDTTVLLEGHTSAVGKATYNKWLSKKRADAVAKQLVADGIAEDRITTVGLGEERLKNDANTKAANAENRRVEAHIKTIKNVKVLR